MPKFEVVCHFEIAENDLFWFKKEPRNWIVYANTIDNFIKSINQIDGLPEWDELKDLDKGAILHFLYKCESEGDFEYASAHYPVQFKIHPVLCSLDQKHQLNYILDRWTDIGDLNIEYEEEERLYRLYQEKIYNG